MQSLVLEAQDALGFKEGETIMLIADLPNAPPSTSPVVIVAQANSGEQTAAQSAHVMGICDVLNLTRSSQVDLFPLGYANGYFMTHDATINPGTAKITIIQQSKHGRVEPTNTDGDWRYIRYVPDDSYLGSDSVVLQVEGNGYKVELHYFLAVTDDAGQTYNPDPVCKASWWIISQDSNGSPILVAVATPSLPVSNVTNPAADTASLSSWLDLAQDYNKLIDQSGVSVTYAALPGGSVGQTTGNVITLDDNANGYGWYIDLTPGLNDEFLPTSNPYEWVAKSGSEAEGKMDLLTVILHEAAHSLGLDHTNDAHALMAPTLQPGVRRLPSPELLAELQWLSNEELAAEETTLIPALSQGERENPVPAPLPLGIGFTAFWAGRMRKSGFGYAFESNERPAYDVAPNPTLLNTEFAGNSGWNTTGQVTFGSNAAVLTESPVAQTRLNQLFTLGDNDRFLRFTLDNIQLDDVNAAPDDAFEVALIDANTGLSLLGGTGLTRSDALLNLQANGTERIAPQVTSTLNPDGSRTYVVDLSGVAPGTVASLSFDLIGFGHNDAASNSRVTVRDLKLGIPQTFDDAVTSAEDTPATIAALSNDLDADQPGFAPVLVTTATHGQVTINADGTFGYTPELNWSGVDSFSYKLSDNRVDSNTSTVTVTVTPVNDAPVAADVSFAMLEEQGIVIDLRAHVSDIDNDASTFTGQILTGPTNGLLTQNTDGSYTYTPNADFNGVDSFTYTVNDGELDSNPATVTITVASVNDAPAGQSSTVTTLEDMPYVFQMSDFGFSDAHGYLRSVSPVRRSRMAVGRGSLPNRPGTMASNRSPK
jgi:VCBS repeat-containing protein